MQAVLITGGSGLIGSVLSEKLLNRGYQVFHLSRSTSNSNSIKIYKWDYHSSFIDPEAIQKADFIIHLAGESLVQKRWTKKQKLSIIESRVKTTDLLFKEVKKQNKKLKAFIAASGVGYYGAINSDDIATEENQYHNDFLGNVCLQWEKSAEPFNELGIRTVALRTGMVLSSKGGALSKLLPTFKWGIGSAIGSGQQNVSWIHIDDLCEMYIKAIEDDKMQGPYNAVAPEQVSNFKFSKMLANSLKKSFWMPNIPGVILKLMLGEMSIMLLKGSRVSSEKIEETGFSFSFPTIKSALQNLIEK
ncbi:MAG: TIGR01777 family oxidoreductase [Flavobacteriaceae bacterium]|nr:TIGR01777 family oxidoreductase [Flavobacteriaceae bacterium]